MALLFMDSFDHYATADITDKWTSNEGWTIGSSNGRNSTNATQCAAEYELVRALPITGQNTAIIGFAVYVSSAFVTHYVMAVFDTGTLQCGLQFVNDGRIQVGIGGGLGSTLGTVHATSTNSLQQSVWYYIEFKAVIHNSTGSIEVRVNGMEWINVSNVDTQGSSNATWNTVAWTGASGQTYRMDDVYMCDSSGSLNNDFLGDVRVSVLLPEGAGNTTEWTPSAGSNYACVDESAPNDDTDYVSTITLNAKDTYAFPAVATGAEIKGVQIFAAVRKATDGPGKIKHVIRSGGTDYDQTEIGIGGTTYSYTRTMHETDPATGVSWTESGVNAAEFGIKKTG